VKHTVKCRKNEVSLNPAIVMNRADLLGVKKCKCFIKTWYQYILEQNNENKLSLIAKQEVIYIIGSYFLNAKMFKVHKIKM
jgi:hypothetical protein